LQSASSNRALRFFGLAAFVIALDQAVKAWAIANLNEGVVLPVLGQVLGLTLAHNDSAAFSLGFGVTWIFAVTSSVAALAIIYFMRKLETRTWLTLGGILLGGIVGNLIDRFAQSPFWGSGHVVDMFAIPFGFPIFNVADIAITSTITISMVLYLRGYPFGKARSRSDEPSSTMRNKEPDLATND
jgi:signal peptidase II